MQTGDPIRDPYQKKVIDDLERQIGDCQAALGHAAAAIGMRWIYEDGGGSEVLKACKHHEREFAKLVGLVPEE